MYSSPFSRTTEVMLSLDFTCCDIEPAVLARNILLYSLIVEDDFQGKQECIWSIFFHFYLDSTSLSLLLTQSKLLAELSKDFETWRTGPYAKFIHIGTSHTLRELHRHWTWYAETETLPAERRDKLSQSFSSRLGKTSKDPRGYVFTLPSKSTGPMWPNAAVALSEAHRRYWETGVTIIRPEDAGKATRFNPIFAYADAQEGLVANQDLSPYTPFLLAGLYNPPDGVSADQLPKPSLQNLNQAIREQFFAWCQAFRRSVQAGRVTLRMITSDALALCRAIQELKEYNRPTAQCRVSEWRAPMLVLDGDGYEQHPQVPTAPMSFDVIETSNLWDHIGILNILTTSVPLLKPSKWAVLYTEISFTYGQDHTKDFLSSLHADLNVISLLFDLVPVSYLWGFRSDCNIQELLAPCLAMNWTGFTERLTWRRPSTICGNQASGMTFAIEHEQLVGLLYNMVERMYSQERVAPENETLISQNERSRAHYNRTSLALMLGHISTRIQADWEQVVTDVWRRMDNVDRQMPQTLHFLHTSDFVDQLHLAGLYTFPALSQENPELYQNGSVGAFEGWRFIPTMVCIAISVPREAFEVLNDESSEHDPRIAAAIGSRKASHHFVSMETFYGTLSVEGEGILRRAYIDEDPLLKSGRSPIIVTFCLPAYLLAREPHETEVRLSVISTPHHSPLYRKLDLGRFYVTPLLSPDVYVLPWRPTVRGEGLAPVFVQRRIQPARSTPDAPSVTLDSTRQGIATFTRRIQVEEPSLRRLLANKATVVTTAQLDVSSIRVHIGSEKVDINFFQPITGQRARLRVSRKEAWIEVIVSPLKLGQLEGKAALDRFPILGTGTSFAWNMHRVPLSHLPRVSVLQPERLKWINHHLDFSLSDREQRIRDNGPATDSLVALKLSINTILKSFVGTAEDRFQIFALSRATGSPELFIFIHALRLDLGSHTIVADGYALPVTRDTSKDLLESLNAVRSHRLRLSDDEMESWKFLLPALVERCRDWAHGEDCAYTANPKVPLSTKPGDSPICSCGAGRVAPDFAAQEYAAPFAALATRIALSPLFSVSYVDPTCRAALRDDTTLPQLLRDHEVSSPAAFLLALHGSRRRLEQADSDTMCKRCGAWIPQGLRKHCGACQTAVYCSEHCQREAWATHKLTCAGRTRQ
ncbi:DUF4470 and zf-MYND domain-containing protein [Phanerochaete sordida]|uniref:DUF4470 and zf-MYND domain-containing protein n=1 Tax=Phanerochaete sordida TaxID=48140 RepID=A0A9P3L912_9APHY|nr:DUF4470 and zf-MYND domain-containing protein [Phanerochaete sordida]